VIRTKNQRPGNVATGLQRLGVATPVTEKVLDHVSGSHAALPASTRDMSTVARNVPRWRRGRICSSRSSLALRPAILCRCAGRTDVRRHNPNKSLALGDKPPWENKEAVAAWAERMLEAEMVTLNRATPVDDETYMRWLEQEVIAAARRGDRKPLIGWLEANNALSLELARTTADLLAGRIKRVRGKPKKSLNDRQSHRLATPAFYAVWIKRILRNGKRRGIADRAVEIASAAFGHSPEEVADYRQKIPDYLKRSKKRRAHVTAPFIT
jgi:hypothetical protein